MAWNFYDNLGNSLQAGLSDNQVTLAKMAGIARGKIIYGDASGDPAVLAVGSADQVLTHDGNDISWEDAGGGAVSAINNATANELVTIASTTTELDAEANLTFDGADLNIVNGNLIVADGHGIDFSATGQGSGTMTSELLDDYEEGTWTGAFEFGGGSTGNVYSAQTCWYTKIGNMVTVTGRIRLSTKGSSTGDARLVGFPFVQAAGTGGRASMGLFVDGISFADSPQGDVVSGSAGMSFREVTNAGAETVMDNTNFGNSSEIQVDFTYRVA